MAPDDLKVGMYVAISERHTGCECCICRSEYDGTPLLIKAISFPFVMMFDGIDVFSIDIRTTKLVKLERKYVKEFQGCCGYDEPKQERQSDEPADKKMCPRCHAPQLINRYSKGAFHVTCQNCGLVLT